MLGNHKCFLLVGFYDMVHSETLSVVGNGLTAWLFLKPWFGNGMTVTLPPYGINEKYYCRLSWLL